MPRHALNRTPPDAADIGAAVGVLPEIQEFLRRTTEARAVRLVTADDGDETTLVLPRAALEALAQILRHMSLGRSVSIIPSDAELSTQEAADLLNVSRPFLVGLLEAGEIPYRKVGTHRRISVIDLMSYRDADDRRRRDRADELTSLTQEMGLL